MGVANVSDLPPAIFLLGAVALGNSRGDYSLAVLALRHLGEIGFLVLSHS